MLVAVANPASGQGAARDRLRFVERVCDEEGKSLKVLQTTGPGDVIRAVTEAAALEPEALIAIGGDGTVGEVCRAYLDLGSDERPPVILVPAGRGNSMYKALLSDAPWRDYVRRVLSKSYIRPIDAARVEPSGDVWVLGFSLGYFHDAVEATRYFRGLRGRTLYAAAGAFAAARLRPFAAEVWMDGRAVFAGRSVLVGLAGGPFRGGRLLLYPTADPSDGALDVVIVSDCGARRFAEVLRAAGSGRHVEMDEVHSFQGAEVRIVSPDPMRCELDGTLYPYAGDELTIRCLPGLLPLSYPLWDWGEDAGEASSAPG
jgi:diacylglycerol kinase (ATP)